MTFNPKDKSIKNIIFTRYDEFILLHHYWCKIVLLFLHIVPTTHMQFEIPRRFPRVYTVFTFIWSFSRVVSHVLFHVATVHRAVVAVIAGMYFFPCMFVKMTLQQPLEFKRKAANDTKHFGAKAGIKACMFENIIYENIIFEASRAV